MRVYPKNAAMSTTFFKIILIKALHIFKKDPLKTYCLKNQIDYIECETINSEKSKKWLLDQSLDVVFNQSQHIVKKEINKKKIFNLFFINFFNYYYIYKAKKK